MKFTTTNEIVVYPRQKINCKTDVCEENQISNFTMELEDSAVALPMVPGLKR